MFRKLRDLILGVFMLAFSVFYMISTGQIKTNKMIMGKHAAYANGQIVPYLLGGLLAILALVLIAQSVLKLVKGHGMTKEEEKKDGDILTVILTFAIIIAYIILLPELGFILSTMLFLFAQITVLAPKQGKKYWVYALVAVVFTAFIFVAFRLGLQQPLPRGVLENLLKI